MLINVRQVLAAAVVSAAAVAIVAATAGDLDPTFDGDGKVLTDFVAGNEGINAIAIQADGKIVAGGFRSSAGVSDFALARYNPDGSLDGTFGFLGTVVTDFGGDERIEGVALQADGRIIAAGSRLVTTPPVGSDFILARYHSDGTLDSTFGMGGRVLTNLGELDFLADVAIRESDGKIIAVGDSSALSGQRWALVCYEPSNGSLDSSFGIGGVRLTPVGVQTQATALAIDNAGRIVVAGMYADGATPDFRLARYSSTGSPDSTFGTLGAVVTDFGGNDHASDVAIQPDGSIVAVGGSGGDFLLARYSSTGSVESSVFTDFGGSDRAHAVALQADGKIVAAGFSTPGSDRERFAVARYDGATGSLDATFGSGGTVLMDFRVEGANDWIAVATSVAIQTDGKIVAAGNAWTGEGGDTDFAVARFLGAGNTPAGSDVPVQVGNVGLQFQNVLQAGDTTVTTSTTGPQPPDGFSLGNPPTYFDITTTAIFSGAVEVCITYANIAFDDETALQLLHYEGTAFVNVTSSLDTVNDVICGIVTSFSPFIIAEPSFVPAVVSVDPNTINKKSKGAYITVNVEFPTGAANAADVDVTTVTLNFGGFSTRVPAGSPTSLGDANGNGITDLIVKFDRGTAQSWFAEPGVATVHLSGRLVSGRSFRGEDTIRVIDEGIEHTNESDPRSIRR